MADMPVYRRIAEAVGARIASGDLPQGAPLPSEQQLAEEFGVTRPTVRQGLAELRATGVITVVNGRGAFVTDPASRALPPGTTEAALRRERDTARAMAGREAEAVARVLELAAALDEEGAGKIADRLRAAVAGPSR